MDSILLRINGVWLRYVRGPHFKEKHFDLLINNANFFGCTSWHIDREEEFKASWPKEDWEKIEDVVLDELRG